MFNAKIIVSAAVLASAMLAGCSNNDYQAQIDSINSRLTQVEAGVQEAQAEASRANQRLDNLSTTNYRK